MTTPMADDAIAAAEACIHAAIPAAGTGHHIACLCPDCMAAWERERLTLAAESELAATHAPALLAEVRRLREEIARMRRASGLDDPLCESCGKPVDVEAGGYSFDGEDGVYLHLTCMGDGVKS